MPDLKERFSMIDQIESPDLLSDARRLAMRSDATSRSVSLRPDRWRRAATAFVAFAVFAGAAVFAWNLSHPDPGPRPRPAPAVDLASELPIGWSELPPPPEVRSGAATAWTGSELLVWGGYEYVGGNEDPDDGGFAFDARTRTWSELPPSPLGGRSDPAFAWTGRELLVWGGWDGGFRTPPYFDDGAAFDPVTANWRMLPPAPIDARSAFSVWNGEEMIVWGSTERTSRRLDGAAYDPITNAWRSIADGPIDITDGSAVWTGDEMIVFGAALDGNNHADTQTAVAAAYDPEADTWRELPPSELSPQAMTASWLDGEMIAWDYDQASAAYDPAADVWRPLERVPLPFSECYPVSVVTSRTVFGDFCGKTVVFAAEDASWHRDQIPLDEPEEGCCSVVEPVAAGDVVLVATHWYGGEVEAMDRRMLAYNPPPVVRTDPAGEVLDPEPFFPPTERDGDHLRMPVIFPNGSEATLVYPIPLGLETLGVQPDVSYTWLTNPPPRYPIVFLHDPNASIRSYVGGATPIATSNDQEIWAMSGKWESHRDQLRGVWLRLRLDSWTVLVASTTVNDAVAVAGYLRVHETPTGFPVVEVVGPLALAKGFGEAEGPRLALGDAAAEPDAVSQLDAAIFLSPDGCDPATIGSSSACLGGGSVFASIYGGREFVESVVDGLRVEHFRKM
jgi:hypothetical protein